MWKIKVLFWGKKNMKRRNIMFSILPALGYLNGLYNKRTEHSICLLWLFFEIEITLRYETKKK